MTITPSRLRLASPGRCSTAAASTAAGAWASAASAPTDFGPTTPRLFTRPGFQQVIAAEAGILESVNYEVGTYTPAWVHLLAARFSLMAEQLRQRTLSVVCFPLSLAAVPADVVASVALRVAVGFARDCLLALGITPRRLGCTAWFVSCLLWV